MTGLRIHIVDDDAAFRDSLAFMLVARGYPVTTHGDPTVFLRGFEAAEPACVICDIRMPGMGGVEVAQALKARNAAIHVILITGHADASLIERATAAGALLVLEKPFSPPQLLAAVAGLSAGEGGV
ncbi:MAG: response regulator transcription factor [Brevundimonas sp.]